MSDKQKSILAMLLSTLGFSLMGVFVKLTGDIPLAQKVAIRTNIILITVFIMMKQANVSLKGIRHYRLLLLRSAIGTVGILLNFYALDHLILSDANVLFRLSTFLLLLFSYIFLGEKIEKYQMLAIALAFTGILFVMKPQFDIRLYPYLVAVLGATCAAGAYTAVRALGKRENPLVVVFFFAAFTSVIMTPITIINYVSMTPLQILYAILAGLGASLGQVGITYAYKHAPAKEVSIYGYFGVIFSAIFSVFIFRQMPDLFSLIGYVIIFGSAYYMYKRNLSQ